ncbi:MAG: helix-turn-helix transcriptional regulator, partial [Candidatus Hodarchaeota archaeon]
MRSLEIKRAILRLFRGNEFYGYNIHKKLESLGYDIELTRLYRVLSEMLKEELLVARWVKSPSGPRRRMYSVGKKGKSELDQILKEAIGVVHEFYSEYLRKVAPNSINKIVRFMTRGLKGKVIIIYIVSEPTVMHVHLLNSLRNRLPKGFIYFIKPEEMAFHVEIDNLSVLGGSFQNIPLKQDFANLLIAPSLANVQDLEHAVGEWHRLLKPKGKLIVGVPTALINEYKDPLLIGQFIEKIEHHG